MKRNKTVKALVLPILIAFLILLPLLGAVVIVEHRYERAHPAYLHHFWMYLLGEEDAQGNPIDPPNMATATDTSSDIVRVLILGKDRAAGLTDVMMLATLDAAEHSLQLLQIPRDTYAAYTESNYKKINGAYRALGGEGLISFLEKNMGIGIDHYVCVDLSVLGEMVDLMGGVTLKVPMDMDYDDPEQELHIHLKAGEQILDGQKAQQFVRFRSGYATADVGRMDAQKLFLSALAKDAKEKLSTVQTVNLVCRCFGKIKTDMSLGDCLRCAKLLRGVNLTKMHMTTLPGNSARLNGTYGAWYYVLNREATEELLSATTGRSEEFDPCEVFTSRNHPALDEVYRASGESVRIKDHTAQGLLDGAVEFRRVTQKRST